MGCLTHPSVRLSDAPPFFMLACLSVDWSDVGPTGSFRDSLAAQLEITLTKADSEQLARSIAEEQYSDLEKEKIMKELEIKEMMARHKQELGEKDTTISSVCGGGGAAVAHREDRNGLGGMSALSAAEHPVVPSHAILPLMTAVPVIISDEISKGIESLELGLE